MDNNILNNLVLYKGKRFSDLIDTNKISAASQQNPYQVATVLSYVFGTKDNGYNTSLDMLTGGLGNVMTIDQPNWEWNVMIDTDRAITIRDAKWNGAAINDNTTAGLGNTPIYLWLEENWFGPTAVLELDNKDYQLRVAGAPYQDGNLWVYTCFIADGNPASYVPAKYLKAGSQVSRLASAVEEYSEEGDILNYSTHFKMRNYLTTIRINYDITGSAYSTVMAIALQDPKTQLEQGIQGIFCGQGTAEPCHPADPQGGGLRRGLLVPGSSRQREIRFHRQRPRLPKLSSPRRA